MARSAVLALLLGALAAGCGGGSTSRTEATNPPPATQISVATPRAKAKAAPRARPIPPVRRDPLLRKLSLGDEVAQVLAVGPGDAAAPAQSWGAVVVDRGADPGAAAAAIAARAAVRPLTVGPAARSGVDLVLGPPLDVGIAGATGEGRALGDDPRTVARRARAALRRLAKARALAAPGHLPGQGTASGDPDAQTATVGLSLDELRARDLVPFRALAPRVPALQLSNAVYAAYDGVTPATLLPQVARTLARGELGFRGALVSGNLGSAADVLGISEARAAVEALQAGDDLLLVPDRGAGPAAHAAIVSAVKAHKLSRRRLDEACSRVLALKRRAKIVR